MFEQTGSVKTCGRQTESIIAQEKARKGEERNGIRLLSAVSKYSWSLIPTAPTAQSLFFYSKDKYPICPMQIAQTLIRNRVWRCLICVCTVYQCPFYRTLGNNGLAIIMISGTREY